MRVLHVVRQFTPSIGGLEDVVAQLAARQRASGDDVSVLTLDRLFQDRTRRLPPREMIDGIAVERIPFVGSSRYPVAPRLWRSLGAADLVHVHGIDFFFDALAWTRLVHRKPLVATTHGGFFHTEAHARLKKLFFEHITRRSAARFDAIVACSASDAALFGQISDRVVTLENGVDLQKFAGCASRSPVRRLVTIGRFSANKRLDRMLDVMARLVARDSTWRLDIIGAPSDWTAEQLEAAIAARGLGPHVDVLCGLDNSVIRDRLGRASLFVSASAHEGFGLVLIEALSAGLRPVVQANAAFAALAQRLPDVTLTDFAEPDASAQAIDAAFRALPASTPSAASNLDAFAWPAIAARYRAIYEAILPASAAAALVAAE